MSKPPGEPPRRRAWCQGAAGLALALAALFVLRWAPAQEPAPPRPAAQPSSPPVVRYELEASLDAVEHRVTGRGTVRFVNASRVPVEELFFHLYLNAFASPETVFRRAEVGEGFRGGGSPSRPGKVTVERLYARELEVDLWKGVDARTPGEPADATDVRVPLPRPLQPNETLTLEIAWVSELPSLVLRTGFSGSFHMVAQWFPKLARLEPDGRWAHFPFHRLGEFYADFGDYDVRIEVPADLVVGATGVRAGEPVVQGERAVHRYRAERVHDFAFAAWDGFLELSATSEAGVKIRCLYPPEKEDEARLEVDLVARGLDALGERYGDYPYETLTIVHPPDHAAEAGGMEYPTLITTGSGGRYAALGLRELELVTVHELAHQWFQGIVATNEDRWPFLDEGLTQWAAVDLLEQWYPGRSGSELGVVGASAFSYMRLEAVEVEDAGPIARPAADFASGDDYSKLVYSRTATTLETLARVHGRERLREALGLYARRHRFSHPTPDDLYAAVGEVLGAEAALTLREALASAGRVDFEVEELVPDGEGEAPGHALLRRHGALRFAVDVELHDDGGAVDRVRWDAADDHRLLYHRGPGRLVAVVIDPDTTVLLDGRLSNNARRLDPTWLAPRVLSHASFAAGALLALLSP